MQRWLLVVKDLRRWMELDNDEITFKVDHPVKKGDKVLVYKSSHHNNISFIFEVKKDSAHVNGIYTLSLFNKITLDKPVTLSELKNLQILDYWQHYFKKPFYKVPLCNWAEIIDYIAEKNPAHWRLSKQRAVMGHILKDLHLNPAINYWI